VQTVRLAQADELELRLAALELQLATVVAKSDICELAATYQRGCDGGWAGGSHSDPAFLTSLFTGDAVYDLPKYPTARGAQQIHELFVRLQELPWIVHYVANPIISVDGDQATGHFKCAAAFYTGDSHRIVSFGSYHGQFKRVDGAWKFASWRFERAEQPPAAEY
jgi:hypothetical protein